MPMNAIYRRHRATCRRIIPVFPLPGALLLPRGQMPLNIFEPRYLAMIDDALRDGHRLIGMIQPDGAHPRRRADKPTLFKIGCVGRITQLAESGDGRYLIAAHRRRALPRRGRAQGRDRLSPVPRHLRAVRRRFHRRARARTRSTARRCCAALTRFPQGQQSQGRLGRHREAPNEALVNALAMMSPYGAGREAGAAGSARPEDPRRDSGRHHRDRARQEDRRRRRAAAAVTMAPREPVRS